MNANLYNILLHTHSVGRWVLLLLLLIAIFNSLVAGGRPFIKSDARTGSLLVIVADIMFLVGAYLWYVGPYGYPLIQANGMNAVMKDNAMRFFAIEHPIGMLVAIIFIHIGKAQARRKITDRAKHNKTLLFYFLALLIILATIPWPFIASGVHSGWY